MDIKKIKDAGMDIKKRLKFAPVIAFVILILLCAFLVQDKRIQKNKIKELSDKIEEMEKKQLQVGTIREELRKVSKYSAYEFGYTSIIKFSDKNKFLGFDIPLTGNFFIATVDGKMNIGINAENMDLSTSTDGEGNVTQVALTVPHSEILDNYTIQETLEIYDERKNIFNPVEVGDYNQLIIEAEEKEEQKVLEGDILQKSDEALKNLLISHLQALLGNDVEIQYEYLEAGDEGF